MQEFLDGTEQLMNSPLASRLLLALLCLHAGLFAGVLIGEVKAATKAKPCKP